ncbi:hypothetical protein ABPG72_012837 [Tetrahymena utriculariae]
MKNLLGICLILAALLQLGFSINQQDVADVVIESANREIDLTQRYVTSTIKLKLFNKGKTPVNNFYYALPVDQIQNTILVVIRYNDQREVGGNLQEDFVMRHQYNTTFIRFELEHSIAPQSSAIITLEEKFVNRQVPYPREIRINEDQKILFKDNAYIYTPYFVKTQYTVYKASNIITHTESEKAQKLRKGGIKFGEFSEIQAFSSYPIEIHSENNTPLIYLTKATKSIDVSHWGNIAVDSSYNLVNEGAYLKGEFGRVDYNKYNPQSGKHALKSLSAELPYHATGVWYRDVIGNISTSNGFRDKQEKVVKLNIMPRYPVVGGWKSAWNLGYNLNTTRYLHTDGNDGFVLKQLFSIPFNDLLAQDYELKVILPEGATDIKSELPFSVDSQYTENTFSYLDTNGRPTLVFKKKNVIDFHNQYFYVHYKLSTINLIKKPLLIFGAFLIFFITLIVLNRLSLKSLKSKNE